MYLIRTIALEYSDELITYVASMDKCMFLLYPHRIILNIRKSKRKTTYFSF
jgi:anaerobic ribonucleoside-triphosphate reductase